MAVRRKISWNEFLMDTDGEFSFKRILTAVFSLMFIALFWINLFTGRMVSDRILDTIEVVILVSIGTIALEFFAKKRTTTITSDRGTVIQEANPLTNGNTAVTKAVESMVENVSRSEPKGPVPSE